MPISVRSTAFFIFISSILLISCSTQGPPSTGNRSETSKADSLFIIDCLLPGQIRNMGQSLTYLTPRRPVKTTASECKIRGGEYVAYDRADFRTALKVWLPQAKSGDAEAQAYVGEIYEKGLGVPANYALAKQWYEKSAAQNNSKAQLNLGFLYEKGLGVSKDLPKAMHWYEKASGLESTGIPYAATLNNSTENNVLKAEIVTLKAALKNSRIEIKQSNKKLDLTQQQLLQQEIELEKSQRTFDQYTNQLARAKLDNNGQEIVRLNAIIAQKETALSQQKKQLSKVQAQYNETVISLNSQLENNKKRAQQINTELKKQSGTDLAQSKLLTTEALLAKTEARLLEVQQQSQQELQTIRTENLQLDTQLNEKKSVTERELELSQQQLIQQQADKLKQEILLSQLQQKNKQYQQSIKKLKQDIKNTDTPKARIEIISSELLEYKKAETDSRQQMLVMQQRLTSTEQQLLTLKQKSDKALLAALTDTANTSSAQQHKIKQQQNALSIAEQRIKAFESKWQKQQSLTQQLIADKQQIKTELNRLQESGALTSLPGELSIEIIDPPIALVRGTPTISLRSIIKQREIIGKVKAPGGLLSLMVNDNKTSTDKRGLFQANIKLTNNETPVSVVAIDTSGQRTNLDFIFSLSKAKKTAPPKFISAVPSESRPIWQSLDFGHYHALIIGNKNYSKIPSLDTPINDAKAVAQVLKEKYAFDSMLVLLDATHYEILTALNKLRASLTDEDNLLIYYAGHGELDQVNMRGHWLPVDADADNNANWISTVTITDILNAMSAKHVLVVSDSCYSGAMTRSSLARIDSGMSSTKKGEWLKAMLKKRSRTVLTSGGLKPVMDGGGGKHSVFAKAFIDALQNNRNLLEGQDLYREVSGGIIATASKYGIEQVPEYAPIHHAGHEAGEFFLIPKF